MCWDRVMADEVDAFRPRLVAVPPSTPLVVPVPSADISLRDIPQYENAAGPRPGRPGSLGHARGGRVGSSSSAALAETIPQRWLGNGLVGDPRAQDEILERELVS